MRYRIDDFIVKGACLRASDILRDYDLTFGFEDLSLFRSPINARPVRGLSLGKDGTRSYVNADHILFLEGVKNRRLNVEGDVVLKPPAMELAKRLKEKDCVLKAAPMESVSNDGSCTYLKNKIRVIEPA